MIVGNTPNRAEPIGAGACSDDDALDTTRRIESGGFEPVAVRDILASEAVVGFVPGVLLIVSNGRASLGDFLFSHTVG